MHRPRILPPLFVLLFAAAGCGETLRPEMPVPPPAAATLASVPKELAVTVRGNPDVAGFRSVFERALGRAGFRVLPAPEPDTLTLSLVGNGTSTSGANSAGNSVRQALTLDMTVSLDGRLKGEHHSAVSYVAAHDRNDETDSFESFNARVAEYSAKAYEWLAVDLTNQLVASLRLPP